MTKDFITILALLLIVVAGWISIDIYQTRKRTTAPSVTPELLEPIEPGFKMDVLNDLKSRRLI